MKKLLTVSLLAIMSVSAANAKIASTEYMEKVAGATLATDGIIADLQTTSKKLVPAINEVKGTADSALSKANANAQTLQSMATSETVSGIDTRLNAAEGEIDALQTAMGTTTDVTADIAAAKKAGTDAATAVEALEDGQVATNTTNITNLTTTKLNASEVSEAGTVGQLVTTMLGTTAGGLTSEINAAKGAAAAAQETADDAATAVEALEDGQVATNTTNITNLTNAVNDQTNGLATKATKAELGINGTLTVPTECQGAGKECALVIINGVAEWQVVQK